MINITTIKSRSRQLLGRLDSLAKAFDYDPYDDMLGRIRELEREVMALKTENDMVVPDVSESEFALG